MIEKLTIFGASGHGGVIYDIVDKSKFDIRFYDDDKSKTDFLGIRVEHNLDYDSKYVIGIGDNSIRRRICELNPELIFRSVISNYSHISNFSNIGVGTVVFSGAVINHSTSIGKHSIINTKASVDHNCFINDYCHIAPGATLCGGVHIGTNVFVGAGATILPNVFIGKNCVIGAGSVVINDLPDNSRVIGIPARYL